MAISKHEIQLRIKGLEDLDTYKTKLSKASKRLKELTTAQEKRTKAGRTSTAVFKREGAQADRLKEKTAMLTATVKTQERAVNANTAAHKRAAASTKKAKISMMGMTLGIGTAIMALRKLSQFVISNVKAFAEFERGVKNVTTLMSQDDTGFFKGDLFKGSLQLSRDFGFALKDVNTAMFNAVSAGISGGEAIKFLNASSELAVAGVTDLKSSTLGLTTVLNAYGMEASEVNRVSEILFTTQKFGVTTVGELSKSLGVVVPFAAASGISLEELGASIAVTTRSGLDAAKSVTALRAAISQMQKPAEKSRDLFIQWGIPIGAAQMKAVGWTETLKRLNTVYRESPRDIELMFGNVRGLTAIFSLAGDNAESYTEILRELEDGQLTAANLQKALAENSDSAAMNIDKLSTAWAGLKVSMGDSDNVQTLVTGLTEYLNLLSDANVSGFDKTALTLAHGIETLMGSFGIGYDTFGVKEGLGTMIQDLEDSMTEESKRMNLNQTAVNIRAAFEKEEINIDEIFQVGDMGVLNLSPKDWVGIDLLLSKAKMFKDYEGNEDISHLNDQEKTEHRKLRTYKLGLKNKIIAFEDFKEEYDRLIADEKLIKANADKDKAAKAIVYNNFERNSRLDLAKDIKKIQDKALDDNEYASATQLKITARTLKEITRLEKFARDSGGASADELATLKIRLGKQGTKLKKQTIAEDSKNAKGYDDGVIEAKKRMEDKIYALTLKGIRDDADANTLKRQNIDVKKAYFAEIKLLSGGTEKSTTAATKALNDLLLQEVKLNQVVAKAPKNTTGYDKGVVAAKKVMEDEIHSLTLKGIQDDTDADIIKQQKLDVKKAYFETIQKLGGETEKTAVSVSKSINDLLLQQARLNQSIAKKNTTGYKTTKRDAEVVLAKAKADLQVQERDGLISTKTLKMEILKLDAAHYEMLIEAEGGSPAEVASNKVKFHEVEMSIAQTAHQDFLDKEQVKIDLQVQGAQLVGELANQAMQVGFDNWMLRNNEQKDALKERLDSGSISQKEYDLEMEALEKKAFKRKQKMDRQTATLNFITELGGIAMNAAANPTNAVTFGSAGISQYSILAAFATARYLGNMAVIGNQKMARGGMVYGNSHANGGEQFAVGGRVVELEGGEAVINKRSSAMFRDELSAMNVAGGGVSFGANRSSSNSSGINYTLLARAIGQNTNVVLPVEILNKVQNNVKVIEDGSRF